MEEFDSALKESGLDHSLEWWLMDTAFRSLLSDRRTAFIQSQVSCCGNELLNLSKALRTLDLARIKDEEIESLLLSFGTGSKLQLKTPLT